MFRLSDVVLLRGSLIELIELSDTGHSRCYFG